MLVPSGTSSNIHSQYSLAHSVYFSIAISSPRHFLILFCISPFTVVYPLHNAPPLGNSAALIYLQPEQWAPDERLGRDRKEHSLLVTDLSHQRGRVQWHPLPGALRHCTRTSTTSSCDRTPRPGMGIRSRRRYGIQSPASSMRLPSPGVKPSITSY